MTAFVIDASALGPLIVPDEAGDLLTGMIDLLDREGAIAPQHWRLEVANLMRMAVRRDRLHASALPGLVSLLRDLPVEIDGETVEEAWGRTLALSSRHDLTVYDAAYLELAQRRGVPLATLDRALVRAARKEGIDLLGTK